MNIKMICPKESIETARLARKKLSYILSDCKKFERREAPWIAAEAITRGIISIGAAYCTYWEMLLLGRNFTDAVLCTVMIALIAVFLSLLVPLKANTQLFIHHMRILNCSIVVDAIIDSFETLSSIEAETPALISSSSGAEAEVIKNPNGDILIETGSHRYVFPMASAYVKISNNSEFSTVDFNSVDKIIASVKNFPIPCTDRSGAFRK